MTSFSVDEAIALELVEHPGMSHRPGRSLEPAASGLTIQTPDSIVATPATSACNLLPCSSRSPYPDQAASSGTSFTAFPEVSNILVPALDQVICRSPHGRPSSLTCSTLPVMQGKAGSHVCLNSSYLVPSTGRVPSKESSGQGLVTTTHDSTDAPSRVEHLAVNHEPTELALTTVASIVGSAHYPGWKEHKILLVADPLRSSLRRIAATDKNCGSSWAGRLNLDRLPNEVLMHVLSHLEVCDLLATSRTSHHFRALSLLPILHRYRLQRARLSLPSLLVSASRPTLADLIARHIFLTHTTQISRRLARSLVTIRLSRRLPLRPSAKSLVLRGVLPGECVEGSVAPGLVAKKRAVERERLKDGLRKWVDGFWKGKVQERGEGIRKWDESRGVGRVWKLRRFWERISQDGKHRAVG